MTTEEIIIDILHTMVDLTSLGRLNVSRDTLNRILMKVAKALLRWKKFEVKSIEGDGSSAVAILTKAGDIIKITIDADDANNSNKIKSEKHKNVVQTHDVVRISGLNLFALHQEYAGKRITDPQVKRIINNGRLEDVGLQIKYFREKAKIDNRFNGIADGLEWLRSKGIEYHDIHDRNILENNNEFVIIDLGLTRNPASDTNIRSLKLESRLENIFMKEI